MNPEYLKTTWKKNLTPSDLFNFQITGTGTWLIKLV